MTELAEAQAEHRLSRLEAALDRLDLLVCDALGFVRLDPTRASSSSHFWPTAIRVAP